jgi:hypothetical protein
MTEKLILHKRGCEILARSGNNPFGQPLYRMVRADSRREWIIGEWRPKYPRLGTSYVVEQWLPAEKYGPREFWEDQKDEGGNSLLGPYPVQGDYEFTFPVWDEHDQPISEPGEHHLQVMAFIAEKNKGITRSMRWAHIQEAEEKSKQAKRKLLDEMIADARPLRGGDAERKYAEELEAAAKPITTGPNGASVSI